MFYYKIFNVFLYSFDISKVGGMYVNETSSNIGKAFEYVKQIAKKSEKPVILFLDEMPEYSRQLLETLRQELLHWNE